MLSSGAAKLHESINWSLNQASAPSSKLPLTKWSLRNGRVEFGNRRSRRVVVTAGFKKVPMEAPGAYRLVDEETGEKVIVWGDDDGEGAVPSRDVLTWKPETGRQARTSSDGIEAKETGKRVDSFGKGVGNFGRLKTNKIIALAKKVSRMKQESSDYGGVQIAEEGFVKRSVVQNSPVEYMEKKKRGEDFRRERINAWRDKTRLDKALLEKYDDDDDEYGAGSDVERGVKGSYTEKMSKSVYSRPRPDISTSKKPVADIKGWNRGDTMQRSGYEESSFGMRWEKPSADKGFFSRKSFRDAGCKEYMIECLRALGFSRPSHIQSMGFAPVAEGKSSVIANQSGSGKTLAYLVPVIQRIREEELQGLSKSFPQSPRVVILAPTAELASQVLGNCRALSKHGVPFRSMVVTGGFKQKTQLESLQQEIDVLIATPGRFLYLIKEGFLKLTNIRCAILDEVDILYEDEEFELAFRTLMNTAPVTTQYLFVTATLPVDIYNKLVETFPDCEVVIGPGMHRTSIGLEEVLVDCSGVEGSDKNPDTAFLNKKAALLQLAEENPVSKTIVFCNKIETCRKVENALNRFDRKGFRSLVLPFHAAVTQETRLANMKEFLSTRSNKDSRFLVCTDRASRGIDFTGVNHVVLFDFPRDPSEYVRRVGRTARGVNGRGKAYVFVVGKQVSLARKIMDRNQQGHPLHDVPATYEY